MEIDAGKDSKCRFQKRARRAPVGAFFSKAG
jgi:hypothetical protein